MANEDFEYSRLADFSLLGKMEIRDAGDIFIGCEFIRTVASNSGMIVAQWANDVRIAMEGVPVVDPGGWHGIGAMTSESRARRVARHANRSAEALKASAESAAKLPEAYRRAFNDVISRRRPKFDPTGGL